MGDIQHQFSTHNEANSSLVAVHEALRLLNELVLGVRLSLYNLRELVNKKTLQLQGVEKNYVQRTELSEYAKQIDLAPFVSKSDMEGLVTRKELEKFQKDAQTSLAGQLETDARKAEDKLTGNQVAFENKQKKRLEDFGTNVTARVQFNSIFLPHSFFSLSICCLVNQHLSRQLWLSWPLCMRMARRRVKHR